MGVMSALSARFAFRLSRFWSERRAVAAVEFAMLLPVLVSLYLGVVELSRGIAADRKVTLTAHALADLATQFTDIEDSDMANILNASTAIMAPYAAANLQVVVSQLAINAQGPGFRRVERHAQRHGAAGRPGREHSGGAGGAEHLSDARRGDLQLQSGVRLCHHRHARLAGPHLHAAARSRLRDAQRRGVLMQHASMHAVESGRDRLRRFNNCPAYNRGASARAIRSRQSAKPAAQKRGEIRH
jgi:hypothetical protein